MKLLLSKFNNLVAVCDEIFQGLVSGGDKLFYLEYVKETRNTIVGRSTLDWQEYEFEKDLCYPLLKGSEIKRYAVLSSKYMAFFPYFLDESNKTKLIPESTLRSKYPKSYAYLKHFKRLLETRGSERMQYEDWYAMWCPRSLDKFRSPKILTQVLSTKANYTLDDTATTMFVGGGNAGGYGVVPKPSVNIYYLLGLLDSNLLDFVLKKISTHFQNGFFSYARRFIEKLPIAIGTKQEQEKIITLVTKILTAKRANPQADTSKLESEIDQLVYQLYGLNEDEIAIVEGKPSSLDALEKATVTLSTEPEEELLIESKPGDYGLHKCGECGKLVIGSMKDEHVREVHRGMQVTWGKIGK